MEKDIIFRVLQNSRLRKIQDLIKECLANAESEENCTKEENEMYADMKNLQESMSNVNLEDF